MDSQTRKLKVAGIINDSIVDGPGLRATLFVQGCNHHCPGCHNPETHSFEGGTWMGLDEILSKIKSNPILDGVTFSGGEPFEQAEALGELAIEIHKLGLNIMTYTGYTFEQLLQNMDSKPGWKKLLENSDILVDGPFILEKKSMMLAFRGSSNQRILDVRASLNQNKPVLLYFGREAYEEAAASK